MIRERLRELAHDVFCSLADAFRPDDGKEEEALGCWVVRSGLGAQQLTDFLVIADHIVYCEEMDGEGFLLVAHLRCAAEDAPGAGDDPPKLKVVPYPSEEAP